MKKNNYSNSNNSNNLTEFAKNINIDRNFFLTNTRELVSDSQEYNNSKISNRFIQQYENKKHNFYYSDNNFQSNNTLNSNQYINNSNDNSYSNKYDNTYLSEIESNRWQIPSIENNIISDRLPTISTSKIKNKNNNTNNYQLNNNFNNKKPLFQERINSVNTNIIVENDINNNRFNNNFNNDNKSLYQERINSINTNIIVNNNNNNKLNKFDPKNFK